MGARVALADRLRERTGLVLEVVALDDARRHPALLAQVLRDGRVLVDRDGRWPGLMAQGDRIRREADLDRRRRSERAAEAEAAFARMVEAMDEP